MKTAEKEMRTSSPESAESIFYFFDSHPEAVLATLNPDGTPHTAVIYITVTRSFETIFLAKKDTAKYQNLQHNKRVSYTCFDLFSRATVTVDGTATLMGTKEEQSQWIEHLQKTTKIGERTRIPPYISITTDDFAVYKIIPDTIHMVTYLHLNSGMYDFHESIEFVTKGH